MVTAIAIGIVVHSIAMIVAGGYLHYRFGKSVRNVADQLKNVHIS